MSLRCQKMRSCGLLPAAPSFLAQYKLKTAENHTCGAKKCDPADCGSQVQNVV
ncbi:MAG: hypothetical protein WBH77_05155 [Saccharofermentanales bacterium]